MSKHIVLLDVAIALRCGGARLRSSAGDTRLQLPLWIQ